MKRHLRSAVEWVLSRLPLARAAYIQRDLAFARVAELEASLARLRPLRTEAKGTDGLSAVAQVQQLDPMLLEKQVPVTRTVEERIAIATRCRDADVLPKVPNAGAVVEQADGLRVQIMHNGIRVVAGGYYGDWMQDLITRCRGHHEPQEETLFAEVMKHLPAGATMLELGGFWSFYSLWFLSKGKGRRSVIVEADPANLEVGRTNARLNNRAPYFINAFVGKTPAAPTPFTTEVSGIRELACVTVDSLMESQKIEHLDLLHCDAQGAELDVLTSCTELATAGRLSWVIVSTHTHHISKDPLTHQRCLAVLRQADATIIAEHDVQESYSGDGLILAKFGPVPSTWRTPKLSYNRYSESLFRNPLYDLAAKYP
ncbi:FkbM family methyltransferase [Belnapia moabensis]|uniref:FkbM family methyltransferase n=1 Tax=Belnapia moabensis TaxID=365533 RepID=UPI000A01C719|nr:FkbM family methyltransferase [Belnapia moabensis]